MKKLIFAAAAAAVILSAAPLCACKSEAHVEYTLSEDGTHYIVSGVGGNKKFLKNCEIPAYYGEDDGELPVTEIADYAFAECYKLTAITLPDTITRIGDRAFLMCSFREFTIPESVEEIGEVAFGMCNALQEITVPKGVKSIGRGAFMKCGNLDKAVVKAEITVLEDEVFYCSVHPHAGNVFSESSLTEVYLPSTLKKISSSALEGNAITDIWFEGSKEQWEEIYFYETDSEGEEKKIEKDRIIPSSCGVHFDVEF